MFQIPIFCKTNLFLSDILYLLPLYVRYFVHRLTFSEITQNFICTDSTRFSTWMLFRFTNQFIRLTDNGPKATKKHQKPKKNRQIQSEIKMTVFCPFCVTNGIRRLEIYHGVCFVVENARLLLWFYTSSVITV